MAQRHSCQRVLLLSVALHLLRLSGGQQLRRPGAAPAEASGSDSRSAEDREKRRLELISERLGRPLGSSGELAVPTLAEDLARRKLGGLEKSFEEQGFMTWHDILATKLSDADLKELGLNLKQRKMFKQAIRAAAAAEEPADKNRCDAKYGSCSSSPGDAGSDEVVALSRRDGVAVGHRQVWQLEDGREVEAETLSLAPLIFKVENFLSPEEADEMVAAAERTGSLGAGGTLGKAQDIGVPGDSKPLRMKDFDGDGALNLRELRFMLDDLADAHFELSDVQAIVDELGFDADLDGIFTRVEFDSMGTPQTLVELVARMMDADPLKRSRASSVAWVSAKHTALAATLAARVQAALRLPGFVVSNSQLMQVVHYAGGGRYTAHMDSAVVDRTPCCHLTPEHLRRNVPSETNVIGRTEGHGATMRPKEPCRLCRFATALYQLNDVPPGKGPGRARGG
jgi:hypothetical protein